MDLEEPEKVRFDASELVVVHLDALDASFRRSSWVRTHAAVTRRSEESGQSTSIAEPG